MSLWVIADTHLGFAIDKSMDIFGPRWADHSARLATAWRQKVREEDTVLIPGDISWALKLSEAQADLAFLDALPGQKILLRGNHDFWWQSRSKIESSFSEWGLSSLRLLQNDAIFLPAEESIICGSRLWLLPSDPKAQAQDKKIFQRELSRLDLSLQVAQRLREQVAQEGLSPRLIAILHYPPFAPDLIPREVSQRLEAAAVERAYFGHIHQVKSPYRGVERKIGQVFYSLIAADQIDFCPHLIPPRTREESICQ